MSAHPVSHVFAAIDSTLVPDLTRALTGSRSSKEAAITGGGPETRKIANSEAPIDRVDPEPHWSAAIDAATD